jgi:glutamine synthetase
MGSAASGDAIRHISQWSTNPKQNTVPLKKASDDFGSLTFNDEAQRARLPKDVYRALRRSIAQSEPLDPSRRHRRERVEDWAVEHGATHYTHWFQLTGITAEKHDSFLTPTPDGRAVAGSAARSSSRANPTSSFPSWNAIDLRGTRLPADPTSPPWLLVTQRHDARDPDGLRELDGRGPRHEDAAASIDGRASRQAVRSEVVRLQGAARLHSAVRSSTLIDRQFYFNRPDLINAGRTLFGAKPPKGQEMEDQYFGSIPDRVLGFMQDVERELYKVGVPPRRGTTKWRRANTGRADLRERQRRHRPSDDDDGDDAAGGAESGLACLLHEKPFMA